MVPGFLNYVAKDYNKNWVSMFKILTKLFEQVHLFYTFENFMKNYEEFLWSKTQL